MPAGTLSHMRKLKALGQIKFLISLDRGVVHQEDVQQFGKRNARPIIMERRHLTATERYYGPPYCHKNGGPE